MFIQQRRMRLLWPSIVSVCAVWILGCSDGSLNAAFSKKFVPDAPSGVRASALPSSNSIVVRWSSASGAKEYYVYSSTSPKGSYKKVGSASDTSYTDSNLSSGTTYYYKISACNNSGESSKSSAYDSATTVPAAPASVSANAAASGGVIVSWPPVFGATEYCVYRGTSTEHYDSVGITKSVSYTDASSVSGETYYYKVSARNGSGEGIHSSPGNVTTVPAAPASVSANAAASGGIFVSWPPVFGATEYCVYRSTNPESGYSKVGGTSDTSYIDSDGLVSGVYYYYKVSAGNSAGESSRSSAYGVARTGLIPPAGVTAEALSSSEIIVSWLSVSGAAEYYVYRSTNPDDGYIRVGITMSDTSYTDSVPSSSTTYYYKVSAYDGDVEGSQSSPPADAKTKIGIPADVRAYAASSSSITVVWSKVFEASVYYVYRSASASGAYSKVGEVSDTSYSDNSLPSGATYYYTVSAYNSDDKESPRSSPPCSATTTVVKPDKAPANVTAAGASASSIAVSWFPVSGAAGYKIFRSTSFTGSYSMIGTTTSASYTDGKPPSDALPSGATYYYRVSAFNSAGDSPQSSPAVGASTMFTDDRDGKVYKVAKIGAGTWLAENLSYQSQTGSSWCYDDADTNCTIYGRLYDWDAAIDACPAAWRLPTDSDWDELVEAAGGLGTAGKKLKAKSGWSVSGYNGNGTDDYGFSALPGGKYVDGYFENAGEYGQWWTATDAGGFYAYSRIMYYGDESVQKFNDNKSLGFSVRCVKE